MANTVCNTLRTPYNIVEICTAIHCTINSTHFAFDTETMDWLFVASGVFDIGATTEIIEMEEANCSVKMTQPPPTDGIFVLYI